MSTPDPRSFVRIGGVLTQGAYLQGDPPPPSAPVMVPTKLDEGVVLDAGIHLDGEER